MLCFEHLKSSQDEKINNLTVCSKHRHIPIISPESYYYIDMRCDG